MRSKTKLLLIGILICSTNIYPESKTATSCTVIEHGKKYYDERGKIETFSELVLCAKLNDFDFDSTNFFNGLKKLKNVKVVSASFVDFSRLNECFIEKMFTAMQYMPIEEFNFSKCLIGGMNWEQILAFSKGINRFRETIVTLGVLNDGLENLQNSWWDTIWRLIRGLKKLTSLNLQGNNFSSLSKNQKESMETVINEHPSISLFWIGNRSLILKGAEHRENIFFSKKSRKWLSYGV